MAPSPTRQLNELPIALSSFIGREREIDDVAGLITASTTRLVTLTGAGGCGKTRLAIAIAHRLVATATFEHGAWFVDLAGLDAPSLVPQKVAVALGLPEARDRSHLATLKDFLQHKSLLLILDNCEHLLSACADLARTLLEACPYLRILATSREPLGLPYEKVWFVPPLAVPKVEPLVSLEQLEKSEAIQLFVERARTVLPDFELDEHNALMVAQICRRLDGIPLALELTAARVKMLDIEQIATRLEDGLQLLSHGSRETPPRHQTMRAALDWGYDLLSPHEQSLFRRLSVFAGGFTLESVEDICSNASQTASPLSDKDEITVSDALDLLSDLVDKSMVLIAEREPRMPVRYRLLEPIRQYALEKLHAAGEEATSRNRHLDYFVRFVEQAEPELKGENQLLWLKHLNKEQDNLRAALTWSTSGASRSVAGLRLARALSHLWHQQGYWSEGRRWLQQAIANHDAHKDDQSSDRDLFLARAIVAEGWLAYSQGDYGETREHLERGLGLAQAQRDWATVAMAQALQAQLTSYAGNLMDARRLAASGVATARRAEEPWTLAWAGYVHGMILYRQDETAARGVLEESLQLFRQVGDRRSIAAHLNTLGYMSANAGQLELARSQFEEALAIGDELADKNLQMTELSNLASLARLEGDLTRAAAFYRQTLSQARDLGKKHLIAVNLEGLGHIYLSQGDPGTARPLLQESVQLWQEIGFPYGVSMSLSGLARIAAAQGQAAGAARVLGAIQAFLIQSAVRRDADDQIALDQDLAAVQSAMSPEEFQKNFAAGQALTLEQAVQEVSDLGRMQGREAPPLAPAAETLSLHALGPMHVQKGEQTLMAWPYARVKELLFYLASNPERTKAQIGLALWPEASPTQLRNSLGTTLYHLRRVLGSSEWILFEEDQYRFNRALPYRLDMEVFESNLTRASHLRERVPEQAIALLEEAIQLYRGDFVEDLIEGEWFLLPREELRRKYLNALLDLGALLFSQGRYDNAAETYRRAIEKENMLEAAHRELMRCYARLGERGRALRQYQALQNLMQTEFDSTPAPESIAIYERLKRGEEA